MSAADSQPPSTRLPDDDARTRITTSLDETLFVEAGAGSGKTTSLVDRVVALVDAGIPMRAIATITFTDKAAGELRHRIRDRLAERAEAADAEVRERARTALDQVDGAAISTLHAFAQRLLTEHPIEASLPPNVEVLDEVASEVEFEDRWVRFRDRLLADDGLARTLLLAFSAGIRLGDLRHLAEVFQDNWDLVGEEGRLPWSGAPPEVRVDELVDELAALVARREECSDPGDRLCAYLTEEIEPYLQRLRRAPDEYERLRLLRQERPSFAAGNRGKRGCWDDKAGIVEAIRAAGEACTALADHVALACLRQIAVEVAGFTLDAARQRRASGRLEFHDLLVLARDLLRGPAAAEVRRRLAARYRRLLLDEFQDTDPIQVDLAVRIAGVGQHDADGWDGIEVEPGRLFFVGDPKQSIYRFRRADIALFLAARERFGPPVRLHTNFRTTPPVIHWVNHVFARLIQPMPGSQPDYQALAPAPGRTAPPDGRPVVVLGAEPHADPKVKADELRDREADDVAAAVEAARRWQVSERTADGRETWRPARLGDITILLPARTSLAALERALGERGIPYRAETSSLVYSTREVRELLAAVRALADPTDQLALVTALRSPLFGCGDDDLFTWRISHQGGWSFLGDLPEGVAPDHPVAAALRYLAAVHSELHWLSPAELLDRLARDRRLFELGYAEGRPRDLWRRLRFVIDQARAWSESEGGTLREYLAWSRLQASESARVAETILPETDDDAVRILTVHGSKGLEFPITIVSGMTTASRGRSSRVAAAFPADGPVALKVGSDLSTPEYDAYKPVDEQMDFHERLRLLYVACTRAKDHLVVSLHRKVRRSAPDEPRKCTNAELLAGACEGLAHDELRPEDGAGATRRAPADPAAPAPLTPSPAALPALVAWEAARGEALAASARRASLGASDVRLSGPGARPATAGAGEPAHAGERRSPSEADDLDDVEAGVRKPPTDLELPPWRKGRYGTAIGRAVHAVLQTVDLATGQGLDDAAAAQAAAEGIPGREVDIARLARAALAAPSVRAAAQAPRWRETYVATTVGGRTLEGYIDLLYRTDAGLVVVDYKTASPGADLDARVEAYRGQGGAYVAAVEAATGEPVVRVVFVFLTAGGAEERDLPDPAQAGAAVLEAVGAGAS